MVTGATVYTQVTYDQLEEQANDRQLTILGGFHPQPDDDVPPDAKTLLLLGPHDPGFWPAFKTSPEWREGQADPMDLWSTRVIGDWAEFLGAKPLYPFGGAPFLPFFSWAKRSGRIHASPIMLLVHDTAGLLVSFRGALALREHVALPPPPPSPCDTCSTKPCTAACPVGAFAAGGYDVPKCKSYLETLAGQDCMTRGCAARRACPVSTRYPRDEEQSAYHMTVFKG